MKFLAFFFDMFGRARRRDFWMSMAVLAILYSVVFLLVRDPAGAHGFSPAEPGVNWLSHNELAFIGFIVLQIATLSVVVKRWHDRNKSGFWTLIVLIPVAGIAWMIFELGFLAGTDGANAYGPSPRDQVSAL